MMNLRLKGHKRVGPRSSHPSCSAQAIVGSFEFVTFETKLPPKYYESSQSPHLGSIPLGLQRSNHHFVIPDEIWDQMEGGLTGTPIC